MIYFVEQWQNTDLKVAVVLLLQRVHILLEGPGVVALGSPLAQLFHVDIAGSVLVYIVDVDVMPGVADVDAEDGVIPLFIIEEGGHVAASVRV